MAIVTIWFTPSGSHFHLDQYCDRVHWNFHGDRMKPEIWDSDSIAPSEWCSGCATPIKRWWQKP